MLVHDTGDSSGPGGGWRDRVSPSLRRAPRALAIRSSHNPHLDRHRRCVRAARRLTPELTCGRNVTAQAIDLGPKLSRASYRRLALHSPGLYLRLRAALARQSPYDALIVHYKKEQLLASLLPADLRRRLIWAEWGPVPAQLTHGPGAAVYAAAAARVQAVLAVSAGTRDSVCAAGVGADRVHVVPVALRPERCAFSPTGREQVRTKLGIDVGEIVIGCISRLHPKKPNGVLIDAVIRLGREDVRLVIAGEGEAEGDLRELARPLGARAHFIGTPGPKFAEVCSAFDVNVFCPSPTEGLPLAVVRSMLASRPVVSSGAEGARELICAGAGTIVSPEHDAAALARALQAYVEDGPRREREGDAGRRVAARMCAAPVIAKRVEELIVGVPRAGVDAGEEPEQARDHRSAHTV